MRAKIANKSEDKESFQSLPLFDVFPSQLSLPLSRKLTSTGKW